jgi:hypothetical protein
MALKQRNMKIKGSAILLFPITRIILGAARCIAIFIGGLFNT